MEALLALIGVFGLVAIGIIYSAFAYGFITYKFYCWFLLPVFTSLPHITVSYAIGLSLFIGLFKGSSSMDYTYKGEKLKADPNWASVIVMPWLLLGAAYMIKIIFL